MDSLSEELLLQITRCINDSETLVRLALVCRKLNRIATPELYANPFLIGRGKIFGVRKLLPFTWLMIKKPELAGLVQSFTIIGCFGNDEYLTAPAEEDELGDSSYRFPFPPGFASDPDFVKAILDYTCGDDDFQEFEMLLMVGSSEDAIITLLLTRLPNLRRLTLEVPFESYYLEDLFQYQGAVVKKRPLGDPALAHLEEIMITGDDKLPVDATWAGVFFGLPVLQRVYLRRIGAIAGDSPTEHHSTFDRETSSVTEIELRQCVLSNTHLDQLVRSCKTLNTFIYELGPNFDNDENEWDTGSIRSVRELLEQKKDDLRNLCLSYRWWYGLRSAGFIEPMAFNNFANLCFLKISAVLLFGGEDLQDLAQTSPTFTVRCTHRIKDRLIKRLPPNIQQLHIAECIQLLKRDNAILTFESFVREAPFPQLQELALYDEIDNPIFLERHKQRTNNIAAAAIERGLTFSVRLFSRDYYEENNCTRGWGMNCDVSWYPDKRKDAALELEGLFKWNHEKGRLMDLQQENDSTDDED